jgi:hypothetical protein
MTETVDQAETRPPRALAGIIEDAWRATCGHCWLTARDGLARSAAPVLTDCTWPASRGPALAAISYGTGGTRRGWPPYRLRNTAHRSPADPTTCVMRASPPGSTGELRRRRSPSGPAIAWKSCSAFTLNASKARMLATACPVAGVVKADWRGSRYEC